MADSKIADKIQNYIAQFLRLTLVVAIIIEIYNKNWVLLFATSLILALTYLPLLIERKYKIYLPIEYELITIFFIYTSFFLGEIQDYYTKIWWWDVLLHASASIALGFAGFMLLYILYYKNKIESNPKWIMVFSFCFALAIGAMWEIFEFSFDQTLGTNTQRSGLMDTMWDLIVDALGAFLTSFIGYYYIKGKKTPFFNRLFIKFAEENPEFFKE